MAKKEEESRLAQILRQELKAGKGLADALTNSYRERQKERSDFRKYFPKGGVAGLALQSMFGKPYQYRDRKSAQQQNTQTKTQTNNLSFTKKIASNTDSMAKDMRIMKINMIRFVSGMGIKAYNEKNRSSRVSPKTNTNVKSGTSGGGSNSGSGILGQAVGGLFGAASFVGDVAGGIVRGIVSVLGTGFKIGAGILGGVASILGSVVGGVLSVGGGMIGGIFRGLASAVSGMGLMGVIALAGAGFLAYKLSQSITGELNLDKMSEFFTKKLKEFFNMKEGESFRDVLMQGLGFIDQKTGMNTKGAFESVETKFIYWLEYSKSMFSQVADTVQKFSKLALIELQMGFLTYGTGLIKLLAQIYGTAIGAKAGMSGAGLASILMGTALGPVGSGAALALRALIAGGTFAGLTAAGFKVGTAGADLVNDALAGTGLNPEQKAVLEKIQKNDTFLDNLNALNHAQEQINGLKKYKNQEAVIKSWQERINEIRKKPGFNDLYNEFQKAFGKTPGNVHEDVIEAAKKNLELQRAQVVAGIPTYDAMKAEADQSAKTKVEEYEDTVIKPSRERTQTSQQTSTKAPTKLPKGKSTSVESVMDFLISNGFTKEQAAGIASNLWAESRLNTSAEGPMTKQGKAFGLAQWLGPRRKALFDWANKNGKDPYDPQTQLDFMMHEFKTSENKAYKLLQATTTSDEAARVMLDAYERSSKTERNSATNGLLERQANASDFSGMYGTTVAPVALNKPVPASTVNSSVDKLSQQPEKEFSEIFMEQFDAMFGTNLSIAKQQMSTKELELKYLATIAKNTEVSNSNISADNPNAPFFRP